MGRLNKEDQIKYDELVKNAEQTRLDMDALMNKPVIYGYARVSTSKQAKDGNSLESQEMALSAAGATEIYSDTYTGTSAARPELDKLLAEVRSGDTIVITKLDRMARSVQQGIELIDGLCNRGIKVHVLNMGLMDASPTGKLIRNVMLCFAEFERDMILQRTREGKQVAKQKAGYKEGRPKKYSQQQIDHAVQLLHEYSYSQVVDMTGISRATLVRAHAYAEKIANKEV